MKIGFLYEPAPEEMPKQDESLPVRPALQGLSNEELFLLKTGGRAPPAKEILASELFTKLSSLGSKKQKFSGVEYAALVDLGICKTGELKENNPSLQEVEVLLKNHRSAVFDRFVRPGRWNDRLHELRQRRIDILTEESSYKIDSEDIKLGDGISFERIGKDPQKAALVFSIIKKLGGFKLEPNFVNELVSAPNQNLAIYNQVFDYLSPRSYGRHLEVLTELNDAVRRLDGKKLSYNNLFQGATQFNPEADTSNRVGTKISGVMVGFGVGSWSGKILASVLGLVTPLPAATLGGLALGVGVGVLAGMRWFRFLKEWNTPFLKLCRKLQWREAIGIVSVPEDGLDDKVSIAVSDKQGESNGVGFEKENKKLISWTERIGLIKDEKLAQSLESLLDGKKELERTLKAAGYDKLPAALKRTMELLESMIDRDNSLSEVEASSESSAKIIQSADSIAAYMRALNERTKKALERDITANASAIKSILKPLDNHD